MKLKEISYTKILVFYQCPRCKFAQEGHGKCSTCKTVLRYRESCEMSGHFPHVATSEWQKQYR